MQRRRSSQQAFTLKELAVVLSVIAIVNLLLFAVFPLYVDGINKHRRFAYCFSNVKQIGLGFLMYAQDYDEHFPPAFSEVTNAQGHYRIGWGGEYTITNTEPPVVLPSLTLPYIKNVRVYECPAVPSYSRDKSVSPTYLYNDLVANVRLRDVTTPTVTLLLAESEHHPFNFGHAYTPDSEPLEPILVKNAPTARSLGKTVQTGPARHNNRGIYAFTDGHARVLKPQDIYFPPRENGSRSHWNKRADWIGPDPAGNMTFGGRTYRATFHIK